MATATAEPTAEQMAAAPFLPTLADRFTRLQEDKQLQTAGFCEAMALILPVFDHLGAIMQTHPSLCCACDRVFAARCFSSICWMHHHFLCQLLCDTP